MPRTYAREEIQWDIDTLKAMAAAEPPQATFFEKANRWVVKTAEGSFGVKPEQIVDLSDDGRYDDGPDPDLAYERYLEDGGPHAVAIAAEDEEEQRREALDEGLQRSRRARANYELANKVVDARVAAGDVRIDRVPGVRGETVDRIVERLEKDEDGEYGHSLNEELHDLEHPAEAQARDAAADAAAETLRASLARHAEAEQLGGSIYPVADLAAARADEKALVDPNAARLAELDDLLNHFI